MHLLSSKFILVKAVEFKFEGEEPSGAISM